MWYKKLLHFYSNRYRRSVSIFLAIRYITISNLIFYFHNWLFFFSMIIYIIAQFQQKQCAFLPMISTKSIFVTPASSGSSAWLFTTRPSACRGSSMWTLTFKRDSESTTCPKHRCDWTHNFHCSSDRHLTCHEQISLVNETGEKKGGGGGVLDSCLTHGFLADCIDTGYFPCYKWK